MNRNSIMILMFSLIMLSAECEKSVMKSEEVVWLKNSSTLRIYGSVGMGAQNGGLDIFPDTTLSETEPFLREVEIGTSEILITTYTVSSFYNEVLNGSRMSVYIFNADSVDLVGWEEIRNRNMVLKRYDLREEDLKAQNYTITYP
ncbi:MAG: hypothetical protein WD077_14665 [Bacteroidia bacterium]